HRPPTPSPYTTLFRSKSWQRLQGCVEDCRAAIEFAVADGAREVALLGFSMGGAVAIASADSPAVTTVIGLAPWIPVRLDVSTLEDRKSTRLNSSHQII